MIIDDGILLFDPADGACRAFLETLVLQNKSDTISSILILEDWEFRTSSPFPIKHKFLSLPAMMSLPSSISIISLQKLSKRKEMKEFFISLYFRATNVCSAII